MNYDPFVKEDFILPEKWCVKRNNSRINEWLNKNNSSGSTYESLRNDYAHIPGIKRYHLFEHIQNGYTEITFEQFKKYVLKEPIEQSKSIEKWSVGSYVVFLNSEIQSNGFNKGDIQQIREYNSLSITYHSGAGNTVSDKDISEQIKWFVTKSEAEEFAKTLVEPVNLGNGILDAVDVKQPLKQAVHCKTQEEWDFVTEKLGNDDENWFIDPDWGNNKSFCISFEDKNQSQTLDFYQNAGYKVLSFQEWCDLNGYKMEKEVKFEVGKWYKMNDCWYLKYKGKDIVATDKIYISECIDSTFNHKYDNGFVAYLREQKTWRLASIEEIQQYLPDSHPDKIKVDREFKIGEYIFVMTKGGYYRDILKVTSVEPDEKDSGIKGTVWIKHENRSFSGGGFRLGSKYRYNEHVRHATPEEINNHLISIGQIPSGEPLNTGIEPNKNGIFKYKQTVPGASWSGGTIDNHLDVMIPTTGNSYNKDFSTSIIPVKSISAAIEFNYLPEPK